MLIRAAVLLVIIFSLLLAACARQEAESQSSPTPLAPVITRPPETKENQKEETAVDTKSEMNRFKITTGVYFGECIGICAEFLTIDSALMHFENFAAPVDTSSPANVDEQETEQAQWAKIVASFDMDTFRALPEKIGDPDASDIGGEYVEVSSENFSKRVDFEYGSSVPEIDDLLELLRKLRAPFSDKYR